MTLLNGHLPAFLSEVERIAKNRGILWQSALDTEQPWFPSHICYRQRKKNLQKQEYAIEEILFQSTIKQDKYLTSW